MEGSRIEPLFLIFPFRFGVGRGRWLWENGYYIVTIFKMNDTNLYSGSILASVIFRMILSCSKLM